MADEKDFKADVFLTDLETDKLCDALIDHKDQTFEHVFKLTFPALSKITSKEELTDYREYFLENFGVHECEACVDWTYDDDLEDGYCEDCLADLKEDDEE